MAQAASRGLPPFWKIRAPAVAASGLPVIATQWRPCSGGFWVRCPTSATGERRRTSVRKRTGICAPTEIEFGNISFHLAARHRARTARALATFPGAGSIGSLFSLRGPGMRCSSVRLPLALVVGLPVAPALFAQGGSIAGVVVSRSSGAPIGDVQVTVTGTPERVFTDARGRFRFDDLAGTTVVLQVRRIGFRGVTDTVNVGDTNLRVALEQKVLELSQVVVTGTSSATEIGRVGNAVSRINAADLTQKAPIDGVQDLLNARAAGVVIQRATGAVGSGSRIRIRGASSFSLSNQPLMYVDGVRVDADAATGPANQAFGSSSISRYNDFNPDDIESIEIVKGPAATTLYGTEASGGVMQIITKQGTPGPARWNFTVRQGANFLNDPEGRFPTNYQRDTATGNIISVNMRDLQAQLGSSIFRTGHAGDYQLSVS